MTVDDRHDSDAEAVAFLESLHRAFNAAPAVAGSNVSTVRLGSMPESCPTFLAETSHP